MRTLRGSKSNEPSSSLVRGDRKDFNRLQDPKERGATVATATGGEHDEWHGEERDRDSIALNIINVDREFDVHFAR